MAGLSAHQVLAWQSHERVLGIRLLILESFCKCIDPGSLSDPDLATRATSSLLVLYDPGRVDEIGKTPISQVQSVGSLPIYIALKLWLNKK